MKVANVGDWRGCAAMGEAGEGKEMWDTAAAAKFA